MRRTEANVRAIMLRFRGILMRAIAQGMPPPELDGLTGLVHALEWVLHQEPGNTTITGLIEEALAFDNPPPRVMRAGATASDTHSDSAQRKPTDAADPPRFKH